MKKAKLTYIVLSIGLLVVPGLSAQTSVVPATSLDELLKMVVAGTQSDNEENRKRLSRFENAQRRQEALLQEAKNQTVALERTGDSLNEESAKLDREIGVLDAQLSERLGNFGELFGVTRQVAGDTRSQIADSLISAQLPGRDIELQKIATGKNMPTMEQLRTLWIALLQEQTEQGKIVRFNSTVSDEEGRAESREVVRVGPFVAMTDGQYLTYNTTTQQLASLAKQPAARYTRSAKRLQNAGDNEIVNTAIDPSRGTILSLLVQTPGLFERFKQGGLPGYVVSFLALIGLSIGCVRLINLWRTGVRVQRQIQSGTIDLANPLGRVLHIYKENASLDPEALEIKLDDAVMKEIPKLDRGLSTMKVLAAVAPLIGLLGTVIGMILTFQAITLWGTGEPKIMAGGISQALVTTVQGLVAAIPLLMLHSLTNDRARRIQQILEEQSSGIIARLAENLQGKQQPACRV